MSHFVYAMKSKDPAPVGGGTTEGWFLRYKWDVDDEAYVPVPTLQPGVPWPQVGDTIWFVMDRAPLGCAVITKVQEDPLNDRHELWYDTRVLQDFQGQRMYHTSQATGVVTTDSSVAFFNGLKSHVDGMYRPRSNTAPQE
jgi:hypothetical protein